MKTNMNHKMASLLRRESFDWPPSWQALTGELPGLENVDDCVCLRTEYGRNRHAKIADFPDKTGFECFINHIHLPFAGTRGSLVSCLDYVARLQAALASDPRQRNFRVIVSISNCDCTVRFHQIRPGESWISENLEGYESEAILVLDVPN
jgi:hypothetical protein